MITKQKGCYDLYGAEGRLWKQVEGLVDSVMECHNYGYIRTPIFESSELFHRGIGNDTDVVSKETYDFVDRGNRNITLRPEGTAGVVRSFIENKMYGDAVVPTKLYYYGTMYRYERPQAGRDREFTQFGAEILGSDSPMADAEIIALPMSLFKTIGLKNIKLKINTLGDDESRRKYKEELVKYFEPNIEKLCPDCKERFTKNPLRILDCKVDKESSILKNAPRTIDFLNNESGERFETVLKYLDKMDILYEIDSNLVRGLDYYNHTVFEIEHFKGDSSSVLAGGGRYNGLVELLGGPQTSCVGFASGVGRVVKAINDEEISLKGEETLDVFIMAVSETEKKEAMELMYYLRESLVKVDTDFNDRTLKAQFKQADRFDAKLLVILKDDEIDKGVVTVKNNRTKEEKLVKRKELLDYIYDESFTILESEYEEE